MNVTDQERALIEAVMLCDFSHIFSEKFHVGDSTLGLGAIASAKQALLRSAPKLYTEDRLRRRAIFQLETLDMPGALATLQRVVTK